MNIKFLFLLPVMFLLACADNADSADSGGAADEGDIVAVVNGVSVPESRLAAYTQGSPVTDENRDTIINNIVISEIIAQMAAADGLEATQKQPLIVAKQAILGRAYAERFLADNPIGEDEINRRFEQIAQQVVGQKEYEVAHILVAEEEQARDVQAKVAADPSRFAALAQEHSTDPGSAQNGGALGWFSPNQLVAPFAEAMTALAPGQMTEAPVKTDFGWHIIRLDNVRDLPPPVLDEQVRGQIVQAAQAELFSNHLSDLQAQATVEIR